MDSFSPFILRVLVSFCASSFALVLPVDLSPIVGNLFLATPPSLSTNLILGGEQAKGSVLYSFRL